MTVVLSVSRGTSVSPGASVGCCAGRHLIGHQLVCLAYCILEQLVQTGLARQNAADAHGVGKERLVGTKETLAGLSLGLPDRFHELRSQLSGWHPAEFL